MEWGSIQGFKTARLGTSSNAALLDLIHFILRQILQLCAAAGYRGTARAMWFKASLQPRHLCRTAGAGSRGEEGSAGIASTRAEPVFGSWSWGPFLCVLAQEASELPAKKNHWLLCLG